jgi:hypothetical protein
MTADRDDKKAGEDKGPGAPRAADKGQKPPVTIDLAAEKRSEPPKAAAEPASKGAERAESDRAREDKRPPPPPPPPRAPRPDDGKPARARVWPLVLAGVIGGIIATGLGIAYHASGVVPTRSETVAEEALGKTNDLAASVAALDKRLAEVEATTAPLADTNLADLAKKLADLETLENENRTRLAKLEAAPAQPPAGGGSDVAASLSDVEARLSKLETSVAATTDLASAVSSLRDRLAPLEASVKDLGSRVDDLATKVSTGSDSERAARAIAIGTLQQAAERGGPFVSDLAMLKTLGMDNEDTAKLEPLATKDTPSLAELQQRFPDVADAILTATSGADENAGFFQRLGAFGRGLVSVRPTTAISGDSPEAIVSRMQAAVDKGDLAGALSERAALPANGQAASADWAQAAADRVAIGELIDKLALSVTAPGN